MTRVWAVVAAAAFAVGPWASGVIVQGAAPQSASGLASAAKPGPVPRLADGHPDLSGTWWVGHDVPLRPLAEPGQAPPPAPPQVGSTPAGRRPTFAELYQPWAREKAKTLGDKDDPSLHCIPTAFGTLNVSLLGLGFVGQIAHTPKFVVMMTETYHGFRLVPTDGRPHRDDVAPSFRGDAVGRWEGDTFVVDISNFNEDAWIHAEGVVSFHSDALHIVERYRRADANTLEIAATIEDPKVLTKPWQVPTMQLTVAPFDQIMEVPCTGTETSSLMEAAAKQNYGRK